MTAVRGLRVPRRVATVSMHTSPLAQPGGGDAGGLNVYVVELSRKLAALGTEVEIFTRATSRDAAPVAELAPGVLVRHVEAGPLEGLSKHDLPAQQCAFLNGVLRTEAAQEPGYYDLVHSHYWLSGQVGWLAAGRWGVPLVHTMHTLARVKNRSLAAGDLPEPPAREAGEAEVVQAADRLVASTAEEADQLVRLYGAGPERVATIAPGVDLDVFTPGDAGSARRRLGLPPDAQLLLFVGRIQPLKAPDLLLAAAARLLQTRPGLRPRLRVAVVGAASGTGLHHPRLLRAQAAALGIADLVQFADPVAQHRLADWYRAATVTVVPSWSESFGLVALESQACGTPVVAAAVGGLRTAVRHGRTGLLVDGRDPAGYAGALEDVLQPGRNRELSAAARAHAAGFSWAETARAHLETYRGALADQAGRRAVAASAS